jgi:hypothetical protein
MNIQQDRCKNLRFHESNLFLLHDMGVNGEVAVLIHVFLTSTTDGDEWPASRPGI